VPAVWRGPPQLVVGLNPETRDWVLGLKNNSGGPCCDTADGFPVEVDGWDMAGIVDDTSGMTPWEAGNARCDDRGQRNAACTSSDALVSFTVGIAALEPAMQKASVQFGATGRPRIC
jgi:hypothetical protein